MSVFGIFQRADDSGVYNRVDYFSDHDQTQEEATRRNIENHEAGYPDRKIRVVPFPDATVIVTAFTTKDAVDAAVRRNRGLFPSDW
jgi:hypothetical protein